MITFILLFITAAVAGAMFTIDKYKIIYTVDGGTNRYGEPIKIAKIRYPGLVLLAVMLIFSVFQPFALTRIDSGSIGLLESLVGDTRGVGSVTLVSGYQIYNDYTERVHEVETDQKNVHYEQLKVIVKGGFPCDIKPTFNYKVKAANAASMFIELRQTFKSGGLKAVESTWLETAILGAINDVSNKYSVDSIFNNRELFEQQISKEVSHRVAKYFEITQFKSNIIPPPALENVILAKTRAVQEKESFRLQAISAEAQAQKQVAIAKGNFEAAEYEAKTKGILSQPKMIELMDAETRRIWAEKGVSPYGEGNVFGSDVTKLLK